VLNNCTIVGNRCEEDGGGAFALTLNDCTVSGNSAGRDAGGVYSSVLNNCSVAGNAASRFGGGVVGKPRDTACIGCVDLPCILNNSIVYHNAAPTGPNYYETNSFNFSCTTPLPDSGVGNIDADPLFVDYAGGNLRLQAGSPCIDGGNNEVALSATDLDGNPRISAGIVDMGAYEFQVLDSFHSWLQQYGLPTNGSADSADSDGDGHNNWQEWRCRTCPTNKLSVLRLISASLNGTEVTVTWESVAGVSYYLERSTNLAAPPYFTAQATNLMGGPQTTSYVHTNIAGPGPFFYRVGVED
jgi:hypothetical protein